MKGVRVPDKWDSVPEVPDKAAIGSLHLSFEYHKTNLKVRVWQISDLLLPPPQTSMIDSLFVRAYLIPDPARKSNRQTEDVKVEMPTKDTRRGSNHGVLNGIQHIFTPSSFRFITPILYTGVTQDIVRERSIRLEVCMKQKVSGKPFLMAMVHMPLRTAVRRPIREKYPLIPCMNLTIPNSMRVYSAKDTIMEGLSDAGGGVGGGSRSSYSRSNSTKSYDSSDMVPNSLDDDEDEEIDKFMKKFGSLVISEHDDDDDSEDDDDDGIGSSFEVKVDSAKSTRSSTVTVDVTSINTDDLDSSGDLHEVIGHGTSSSHDSHVVELGPVTRSQKKRIIPNELLSDPDLPKNKRNSKKGEESSVIEIDQKVPETVVDMSQLQREVVVDLESSQNGLNTDRKDSSPAEQGTPMRKKRIIPNELKFEKSSDDDEVNNKDIKSKGNSVKREDINSGKVKLKVEDMCVYDEIRTTSKDNEDQHQNVINSATKNNSDQMQDVPIPVISDGFNNKSNGHKSHSSDNEISGSVKNDEAIVDEITSELEVRTAGGLEVEPSSTPASRPETPIWDYYDFTEEEAAAGDAQTAQTDTATPTDAEAGSPTIKQAGTLQESLARLKRPVTTLDTCRVAGPVLPATVLMEDLEMEEDEPAEAL